MCSEFVMVPRAELERWQKEALQWKIDSVGVGIMHVLAKPHQGEPVELPTRKITNVLNYHAALGAEGWNACLDEIAKLGPLYTHADPAEIERLRIGLGNTQALLDQANYHKAQRGETIDTLRAQLAEVQEEWADESAEHRTTQVSRDTWRSNYHEAMGKLAELGALLRDAHEELVCRNSPVAKRIDAALSANAEPSAPTYDVVQHNSDRYVAIELAGVMEEFLRMPCRSLEDRMQSTFQRYEQRIRAMIKAHQGFPELCQDEGCPHHGIDHICVTPRPSKK